MAITTEQVTAFSRLFKGRENAHGEFIVELGKGPTKNTPATAAMYKAHLQGKGNYLGIVPVTLENLCYFAAIDVDDVEVDHAALQTIVDHAELPLVTCRSKSGGAHVYVFLKDPAPATLVRNKLRQWIVDLGLKNPPERQKGVDKDIVRPVEVFPKNTNLKPDELGNWINLPYYGGDDTNRYAVTAEGKHLNLAEFLDLAGKMQVSSMELEGLEAGGFSLFREGPPCLQTLHGLGYPEGSRNSGLFNVTIALKAMHPDNWKEEVEEYNQEKLDPPLKPGDVMAITKSVDQRDYVYKCEELPIQPHCHKVECKKRKYGISFFKRKHHAANLPALANLRKVTTDPPRWIIELDAEDVELTTDDLMQLPKFRKAVMERCNKVFPLMKQADWDDVLITLFQTLVIIEAPQDAGVSGQFRQLLADFMLRRKQAHRRADLLATLPYQQGVKVYFRGMDLWNFLQRKHFREYNQAKMYSVLRTMGAGHDQLNIGGQTVQVWLMDAPQDDAAEESFELPEKEQEM